MTTWKNRFRRKRNESIEAMADIEFDSHCLLLKNLFDQKLAGGTPLSPDLFYELFDRFAEYLEEKSRKTDELLSALVSRNQNFSILLTSNFSEIGRMSLEGELRGDQSLLSELPAGPDVVLVIKPHPRDSKEKMERLQSRVSSNYKQTIALLDPWTFHLPFESKQRSEARLRLIRQSFLKCQQEASVPVNWYTKDQKARAPRLETCHFALVDLCIHFQPIDKPPTEFEIV